ncbi:hypothetical protein M413DRAFT_292435 [Hebeloma cylindrosporum]|uniref:Uncharacterized protein n=1 Tax=Hebeloma cylindrosporum TaxID=76867 RepID=A0A0C3BWB4_HEBCY|nr:hypothetical protein M413DRAFT_292435 [Hebeloma cylindrosporum h7]
MRRSEDGNRSLGWRLRHAVPRFRSRSPAQLSQLAMDGSEGANSSALKTNGATSSAQAPPIVDNSYKAIAETTVEPTTMGSVAYEGLKTVLQGVFDCSDAFLPLKSVSGGLLAIFKIVDFQGTMRSSKVSRQSLWPSRPSSRHIRNKMGYVPSIIEFKFSARLLSFN